MSHKLRVLVVDDARYILMVMERLLSSFDCEIKLCSDSKQVVRAVQEFSPHVIFLDIQMPGRDGFEVAEDLYDANLRDHLLVAMTIYSDEGHRHEAEACGFHMFLPKPPAYDEIANVVETAKEHFLTRGHTSAVMRERGVTHGVCDLLG